MTQIKGEMTTKKADIAGVLLAIASLVSSTLIGVTMVILAYHSPEIIRIFMERLAS